MICVSESVTDFLTVQRPVRSEWQHAVRKRSYKLKITELLKIELEVVETQMSDVVMM